MFLSSTRMGAGCRAFFHVDNARPPPIQISHMSPESSLKESSVYHPAALQMLTSPHTLIHNPPCPDNPLKKTTLTILSAADGLVQSEVTHNSGSP